MAAGRTLSIAFGEVRDRAIALRAASAAIVTTVPSGPAKRRVTTPDRRIHSSSASMRAPGRRSGARS